jgi:hypothetical protein
VEEAVLGLLKSGLQGEARKGDTLGLWSYRDQLHPEFPMQVWSEQNKGEIAETVQRFLRHLRYEKSARLDKVWPAVRQVLGKSERLTVIFIYDGEETLRGTPFDEDINDLQKQYRREFRAAHLPLVTVLAARDGQFFDYTINYPGSITVPHTADPLPPPETNAPPVAAAPSTPAPSATNAPVEPKPPRRIEIVMKGPAAAAPAPAPAAAAPAPAPAAAPPAAPVPPAAVSNQVVPVTPPPSGLAKPSEPLPPAAPPPQPVAPVAPVAVQITNNAATPAPSAAPPAPPARPAPPPIVAMAPAPAPAAPVSQPKPPAARPGPMPVAVASTGQQAALFVLAFSLLTIAAVLVIFLLRRSRARPHSSLISQSIDRSR